MRRRWFLAFALGSLAAAVSAVAAWYLIPAMFLSVVVIHIDSKHQSGAEQVPNPFWLSLLMKTSADRLKSKEILMKTLKEDGVRNLGLIKRHPTATAAVMWLETNLKVEYREGSELLTVQLSGQDPQDLVRLSEAHTNAFLTTINGEERRQRKARLATFTHMLEEEREKLREKNNEKEALYRAKKGKTSQSLLSEMVQNRYRLDRANEELKHHRYTLETKKTRLAKLVTQKAHVKNLEPPDITLQNLYAVEPDLATRAEKVKKLEGVLERFRIVPDDDPIKRDYTHMLAKAKKELETGTAKVRAELEEKAQAARDRD